MKINFDKIISSLFEKDYFSYLLVIFLFIYGGNSKPKLPKFIKNLFEYSVFRIFILSLILYKSNSNTNLSLILSLVFVLITDYINKNNIKETFEVKIDEINNLKKNLIIDSIDKQLNEVNDMNGLKDVESKDKINFDDLESELVDKNFDNEVNDMDSSKSKDISTKLEENIINNVDLQDITKSLNSVLSQDLNNSVNELVDDSQSQIIDSNESNDSTLLNESINSNYDQVNCIDCSDVSLKDFVLKIRNNDFNNNYFNDIKWCYVVDLFKEVPRKYKNAVLRKLDLTDNDLDGPIGTAYVDLNDAKNRLRNI